MSSGSSGIWTCSIFFLLCKWMVKKKEQVLPKHENSFLSRSNLPKKTRWWSNHVVECTMQYLKLEGKALKHAISAGATWPFDCAVQPKLALAKKFVMDIPLAQTARGAKWRWVGPPATYPFCFFERCLQKGSGTGGSDPLPINGPLFWPAYAGQIRWVSSTLLHLALQTCLKRYISTLAALATERAQDSSEEVSEPPSYTWEGTVVQWQQCMLQVRKWIPHEKLSSFVDHGSLRT